MRHFSTDSYTNTQIQYLQRAEALGLPEKIINLLMTVNEKNVGIFLPTHMNAIIKASAFLNETINQAGIFEYLTQTTPEGDSVFSNNQFAKVLDLLHDGTPLSSMKTATPVNSKGRVAFSADIIELVLDKYCCGNLTPKFISDLAALESVKESPTNSIRLRTIISTHSQLSSPLPMHSEFCNDVIFLCTVKNSSNNFIYSPDFIKTISDFFIPPNHSHLKTSFSSGVDERLFFDILTLNNGEKALFTCNQVDAFITAAFNCAPEDVLQALVNLRPDGTPVFSGIEMLELVNCYRCRLQPEEFDFLSHYDRDGKHFKAAQIKEIREYITSSPNYSIWKEYALAKNKNNDFVFNRSQALALIRLTETNPNPRVCAALAVTDEEGNPLLTSNEMNKAAKLLDKHCSLTELNSYINSLLTIAEKEPPEEVL